jgi:hypothetical protein
MDLCERGWGVMDWNHLAQDRYKWLALADMAMNFGFHKTLKNSGVFLMAYPKAKLKISGDK